MLKLDGSPISVELNPAFVERVSAAVCRGPLVENRQLEIGGLLLGRRKGSGLVEIDDFEELASEHRRGASFDFSPGDRGNLGRRLASLNRRGGLAVVGYFRSHTRPGLYLDEGDNLIAHEFFRDVSQVFLLIKPQPEGRPLGGFFFWENGELDRRQPRLPFAFNKAPVPQRSSKPVRVIVPHWASRAAAFVIGALAIPGITFLVTGLWSQRHVAASHPAPKAATAASAPLSDMESPPEPEDAAMPVEPPRVRPATRPTPSLKAQHRQFSLPSREAVAREEVAMTVPPLPPPEPLHLRSARPQLPAMSWVSFEPVRESFVHKTLRHIPLVGRLEKRPQQIPDQFVPARPLKKNIPPIPPALSARLKEDLPVDVKIRIDKNGEVAHMELVSKDADPEFATLARYAISRWDFEPARLRDKPVPSEMLVHFRFQGF